MYMNTTMTKKRPCKLVNYLYKHLWGLYLSFFLFKRQNEGTMEKEYMYIAVCTVYR
jgi:hypothetical protein